MPIIPVSHFGFLYSAQRKRRNAIGATVQWRNANGVMQTAQRKAQRRNANGATAQRRNANGRGNANGATDKIIVYGQV